MRPVFHALALAGCLLLLAGGSATAADLAVTPNPVLLKAASSQRFSVSGGTGTYQWSASAGSFDTTTTGEVLYTAPRTTGEVRLTVRDSMGQELTVLVRVLTPLRLTPARATIQPGDSVAVHAVDGSDRLTWAVSAGRLAGSGERRQLFTPPREPGEYEVSVTDQTFGERSRTLVTVVAPLRLEPTSVLLRPGEKQRFVASGGGGSYVWTVTEGSLSPSKGPEVEVSAPSRFGEVTVKVVDALEQQASATITILPPLRLTPGSVVVQPNARFSITAVGGSGRLGWQAGWTAAAGNLIAPAERTATFQAPAEAGMYQVTVKDERTGESQAAAVKVVAPLSLVPPEGRPSTKSD